MNEGNYLSCPMKDTVRENSDVPRLTPQANLTIGLYIEMGHNL